MRFVLDCSISMAWCFKDEATRKTDAVLELLLTGEALVPSIWPLEVANALLVAERSKRIKQAHTMRINNLLRSLPIVIEETALDQSMGNIISLARSYNLSSYDGAYMELAIRKGLPLATNDNKLAKTAKQCGLKLLPK